MKYLLTLSILCIAAHYSYSQQGVSHRNQETTGDTIITIIADTVTIETGLKFACTSATYNSIDKNLKLQGPVSLKTDSLLFENASSVEWYPARNNVLIISNCPQLYIKGTILKANSYIVEL